jgi:hypothetical protein
MARPVNSLRVVFGITEIVYAPHSEDLPPHDKGLPLLLEVALHGTFPLASE